VKGKEKKRLTLLRVLLCLLAVLAVLLLIFMHFGGFGTGKGADAKEFAAYAGTVEEITIPENAKVIALGEATHGNAEFQQLKLDVFKNLVENYGVRAFALEGDCGGCEQVNRYIHGGEGTAADAAAAIGFAIYRTDEMADLISYMRQYNDAAPEGQDLRFYGFDMQRYAYSFQFLTESCRELGVDTGSLEKLMDGKEWSGDYDTAARTKEISQMKAELETKESAQKAIHFADMLLLYLQLQDAPKDESTADWRDALMAQNVQWIQQQEAALGCDRIFMTGHNCHVAKWASCDYMGKLLSDALGDGYYAIGTDFFKTCCNLPSGSSGQRTNQTFYSYDPLAVAAKEAGLNICWLDFSKVPKDTELFKACTDYTNMGTLGEGYHWYMRLLTPSYRMFQPPAEMYDSMIFVADAHPILIQNEA
jgi:erythromycin esterase